MSISVPNLIVNRIVDCLRFFTHSNHVVVQDAIDNGVNSNVPFVYRDHAAMLNIHDLPAFVVASGTDNYFPGGALGKHTGEFQVHVDAYLPFAADFDQSGSGVMTLREQIVSAVLQPTFVVGLQTKVLDLGMPSFVQAVRLLNADPIMAAVDIGGGACTSYRLTFLVRYVTRPALVITPDDYTSGKGFPGFPAIVVHVQNDNTNQPELVIQVRDDSVNAAQTTSYIWVAHAHGIAAATAKEVRRGQLGDGSMAPLWAGVSSVSIGTTFSVTPACLLDAAHGLTPGLCTVELIQIAEGVVNGVQSLDFTLTA